MNTLNQLLLSSRPVSWLNTAFPFAATYLILTRDIDRFFIVGTVFFLIPYNLLMYGINDVFDYESDLQNPRKQGIEGIRLKPEIHRITIYTAVGLTMPFAFYLMLCSNVTASWVLLLVLFNVAANATLTSFEAMGIFSHKCTRPQMHSPRRMPPIPRNTC